MPSRTIENYLKQLYLEQQAADKPSAHIPMGRLASLMSVVPGTATAMVKALADSKLVHYSPRTGVKLTDAGSQLALHVLRRHRLVELFLVKTVGLDWSEVHAEAEELEHVISEKLLEKIDTLLGHPTTDPHGDPIPNANGKLPPVAKLNLASAPLNCQIEIARILDQDPAFLRFAEQTGLVPGTKLKIIEKNSQADSVFIHLPKKPPVTLSSAAAAKFLVKEMN